MINQHTKFEVSMFNHYNDMKGTAKCINWGGLLSLAMSPFDRVPMTMHLSCTLVNL